MTCKRRCSLRRGCFLEAAGFVTRKRSSSDERLVEIYPTEKGKTLHTETGCLTDTLPRRSCFTVPQMIELNEKVQTLRDGLAQAGKVQAEQP